MLQLSTSDLAPARLFHTLLSPLRLPPLPQPLFRCSPGSLLTPLRGYQLTMLDALPLDILLHLTTLLPPASLFALSGVCRPLHALFHAPSSAAGGGDWFARRLRRTHPASAGSSLLAGRGAGLALAKAAAVGDCHLCGHPGDVGVYAASAAFAGVRGGRGGGGDAAAAGSDRRRDRCRGGSYGGDLGVAGVGGALPGGGGAADDAPAALTLFPICAACYAADPRGTTAVVDARVTHEVHPGLSAAAAAAAARAAAVRGTLWTEYVGGGGGGRWVVPRPVLAALLARPRAALCAAPRRKRRRGEPGDAAAAAAAAAAADTCPSGGDDSDAGSDGRSPRTVRPARRRRG